MKCLIKWLMKNSWQENRRINKNSTWVGERFSSPTDAELESFLGEKCNNGDTRNLMINVAQRNASLMVPNTTSAIYPLVSGWCDRACIFDELKVHTQQIIKELKLRVFLSLQRKDTLLLLLYPWLIIVVFYIYAASLLCLQSLEAVYHQALRFIINSLYARVGWPALCISTLNHQHALIYKEVLYRLLSYLFIL